MAFTTRKTNGVILTEVDGQLIVGNRSELKEQVTSRLQDGEKKFVIDFGEAHYVDSSGLGILVSLDKRIREQGGQLVLAGLSEDLRMLFELTKLDTLFTIVDSRAEALSVVEKSPGE